MSYTPLYRVFIGSHLVLDGRSWRVTGREEDGYIVEGGEDGEYLKLTFERVDQAIKDRNCEVTAPKDLEKRDALLRYTGGRERIEQLSKEQQKTIRSRLSLVLAMDALEAEGHKITQRNISKGGALRQTLLGRASEIHKGENFLGPERGGRVKSTFKVPEGRTLKEYQATYHIFDENPIVLMDRDHLKGNRNDRMTTFQRIYIDHVAALWLDPTIPKLKSFFVLAEADFHVPPEQAAKGFEFPSITTVKNYINGISPIAQAIAREGKHYARNRLGAGATDIRAGFFGENVEADQVYLSLFTDTGGTVRAKRLDPKATRTPFADDEICRLWLHVLIDVATRLPLAWIIAKSADADHTEALLRMATRDKTREKIRYGCKKDPAPPVSLKKFVADNGGATRNGQVYAAQLGLGMTLIPGRAYHSSDKPVIEKLFGTIQWGVLNFLPGYTGSRPGELRDYDPKASVGITHDEVYGTLTRYFVDEYSHKPHFGTGMFGSTPWEKLLHITSTYRAVDAPSQRDRCLHLGIKSTVSTTTEGVKAFNIPFNSSALQRFAGGASRKVTVHLDPDDLRKAYVTATGHPDVIAVDLSMTAFADLTLEEAIDLMEETARRKSKAREISDADVKEARALRARATGFFPDTRDPSNYRTTSDLRRRAERMADVSTSPQEVTGPTARAGHITVRDSGTTPAFKVDERSAPAASTPPNAGVSSRPSGKTFMPIKESKL